MNKAILILSVLLFIIGSAGSMVFANSTNVVPLNTQASNMLSEQEASYPYQFVVLGDGRRNDAANDINPIFADILDEISVLSPRPSFVIDTGDLVQSSTEGQYIAFHNYISSWMDATGIPFFSVPGNHEFVFWEQPDAFEYYARYVSTELDYYFDFGNSRFIVANNTHHPGDTSERIYDSTLESVESWLESAPANRFTFVHIPIVREERGGGLFRPGHQAFQNLLVNYGVRACFNGHIHGYRFDVLDNVYHVTSGGGGSWLTEIEGQSLPYYDPPFLAADYHWLLVTVDENNNVLVEMYLKDVGHNALAQRYDFVIPGQPTAVEAVVDIHPNTLNAKSKGKWITAYVELPPENDIAEVDISTVRIRNSIYAEEKPTAIGDYDDDGIPDLMVKFDWAELSETIGDGQYAEIILEGALADGTIFEGSDTIRVIDK